MRLKITIGLAALVIGTALASVPASAQQGPPSNSGSGATQTGTPGYSSDGGVVSISRGQHQARGQNMRRRLPITAGTRTTAETFNRPTRQRRTSHMPAGSALAVAFSFIGSYAATHV
jgi:hypothetical protein